MKSHTLFTAILVSGALLIGSNFALATSLIIADRINSEKTDKTDRNKNTYDIRGIDGAVKDPDVSGKQKHPSRFLDPFSFTRQSLNS